MAKGKLYLIPTPIGDRPVWDVLPASNRTVIDSIDYFIVEDIRSARRFLSKAGISRPIDSLRFAELNEHTAPAEVSALFAPLLTGTDAGVLSEAGLPGVADPGADAVALAHIHGIEVVPLVGPSSILLALMASGLNGQSFAFNGYLPIRQPDRNKAIRHFEARTQSEHQSQIFIEAPYRNLKLYEDFCTACRPQTRLTIAADLLQPDQLIRTRTIGQWRKEQKPDIQKRPAIFILGWTYSRQIKSCPKPLPIPYPAPSTGPCPASHPNKPILRIIQQPCGDPLPNPSPTRLPP